MADEKDKKDETKARGEKSRREKPRPKNRRRKKPLRKKTGRKKPAAKKAGAKKSAKKAADEKRRLRKKPKPPKKRDGEKSSARRKPPTPAPPVVRASARYVRVAPRKARLIADQVRGLHIEKARALLQFSPRGAAQDIHKLIDSAAANAENNHDLVGDEMRVTSITVDEGPTLRRFRPRALGPGDPDQQANQPHRRGADPDGGLRTNMGQKIHPEGFRVGYIHDWKSNWFEEKNFADVLQEDLQIRDHIENKLSHAGLSNITIERRGEVAVDIHTARPGIVIGKSGSRSRRAAQRAAQAHRQPGQSQHPRGQAARARRQAGRPVDRRAAAEPGRLPPRDETRADLGDALRRQGRQGPGLRSPRRRRDGADRKLLRRPRAAAHAARRHRLRLLRGPHDDRPDRRQMLDQQGRSDARGLPLRPRLDR